MAGLHFESLLELNPNSAKYLTWTVRVLHGRIVHYEFKDRRQSLVKATKFECVLVSSKPEEYIMATVRHNYRDAKLVEAAKDRYRDGTVWRMSQVAFAPGAQSIYNGAPNKYVALLEPPTGLTSVMAGTPDAAALAEFVLPALRLSDILQVTQTRTLDACVCVASCEAPRKQLIQGQNIDVTTARLADASYEAEMSCWGSSAKTMHGFAGKAVVVLGISATLSDKGVKLNLRDGSVIMTCAAPRLTEMEQAVQPVEGVTPNRTSVTALWSPQPGGKAIDVHGSAVPSCAAIVDVLRHSPEAADQVLQLMGVRLEASMERILNQEGSRLYMIGQLRDWSGCTSVVFIEPGIIELFACKDKAEVEHKFQAGALKMPQCFMNVRGVLRSGEFQVASCLPMPPFQQPTCHAEKLSDVVAVCGPFRDGILPCRARDIRSNSLLNLGVAYASDGVTPDAALLAPHQVLLLVQGTTKSALAAAHGNANGRVLTSTGVKCWSAIEEAGPGFTLRSYCHEDDLMDFTLNKNAALVWISGVLPGDPPTYVVDRLDLVDPSDFKEAVEYIRAAIKLASKTRMPVDTKGVLELTTPQYLKRARQLDRWPSEQKPAP